MSDQTLIVIVYISVYSIFLPISISLYAFRKTSPPFLYIYLYLFFSVITEMMAFRTDIRAYLHNSLAVIQVIVISLFYASLLGPKTRKAIISVIIIYCVYFLIESDYLFNLGTRLNSLNWIASLLFIVYATLLFYHFMTQHKDQEILQNGYFWVNSGLMLYFAGTFFVFSLIDFVENSYMYYLPINGGLNVTKNILLTVGIWKGTKT